MTYSAQHRKQRGAWKSYIISSSGSLAPGTWYLYERGDLQEKNIMLCSLFLMITYTESNFYMQQWLSRGVMWIFNSWEHSWNEIRLKTRRLFFRRAACHYLNWELGTFWKQQLIGCSQSFRQSEQSLTLFPSLTGVVPAVPTIPWQRSPQRSRTRPQSALPSRCAVPLFSFIQVSNSLAPGSSPWGNLTVCCVARGASLDFHMPAPLSQAKRARVQNPINILSLMLLSNCFSPDRFDFTAQMWRWYVAPHWEHTVSWPLLICAQREMAHVQARCGYYCCGCTVVVSESHLKPHPPNWSMYEWMNSPLSWQSLWWLLAQKMTKSCRTSTLLWCGPNHRPTRCFIHKDWAKWCGAVGHSRSSYYIRFRHAGRLTLKETYLENLEFISNTNTKYS